MNLSVAHRDGQQRIVALVASLARERLEARVPATPAWRVRDLIAHMCGVCEDALAHNLPDFSDPKRQPQQALDRDDWTQAQVERRRDLPFDELLRQWDRLARRWEEVLALDPTESGYDETVRSTAAIDVGCHLHDLRHALGAPGDRDAPTTAMAFALGRGWLGLRLDAVGLPGVRMRSPDREWVVGHHPVGIALAADRFELFRSITGRRSERQLLRMDWDDDPAPYLDVLSPYQLRDDDITE